MSNNKRLTRTARILTACVLTVCLFAGLATVSEPVFAGMFSTKGPFNNTRSSYNHNGKFYGNVIANGVDVSYYQSTSSDWNKAKKAGVDYAIIRVTWSGYGSGSRNIDSKFLTHYKKCKAAGIMTGVYVFSQATTVAEARAEAQYGINRLKALGIGPEDLELPVYMDYEFSGPTRGRNRGRLYGISSRRAIECANAFCEVVRANGYDPGVYANTMFFRNQLGNGAKLASDIDLWVAQYYSMNESPCNYTKWQYSSSAKIDGILFYSNNKIGSTDVNFWYLNKKKAAKPITTIYGVTELNYTGKPVLPELEVYAGSTVLQEGKDYIVAGINNINKSTTGAYAYVKGIGKYSGYAVIPLTIGTGYKKHVGMSKFGGTMIMNASGSGFTIGFNDNGAYVRNVTSGIKVSELKKKIKLKSKYREDYKLEIIDGKGAKLGDSTVVRTGMMVGVYKGSTLAGTADITVKGDTLNDRGGNYIVKANRKATYTSTTQSAPAVQAKPVVKTPGKATIKKLKGGKRCFTVTINKLGTDNADGYEVKYSRFTDMSWCLTKELSNKNLTIKKKIKKLRVRKTYYYVQVRSYVNVNGARKYSAWSKAKKVWIK